MKSSRNVLMIGADLSSNGGIASVVRALYEAHAAGEYPYRMWLVKTNYYKDKGRFHELLILFASIARAIRLSLAEDIGIFHIHSSARYSFYRKAIFVVLGKLLRKKVVFHIHSSEFYNFFLKDGWLISRVLRWCDRVVVLCEDWRSRLQQKYPDLRIVKIENPNSFALPNQTPSRPEGERFKIVFVGFLIESKGIRDLVALARRIKESGKHSMVIQVAGKGELAGFVRSSIDEQDLHQNLEFVGWVSGSAKDVLYREADVFLLPSYREGMPISILEAMAWGLPVVSTRIAGTPDIVESGVNGFLLEPGDVEGYFAALCRLAADSGLRRGISRNNLARVARNSGQAIFSQVDALYATLPSD